jgi:hypothetical protein
MGVIVHIGPPKTATTSLQSSVIPRLGLPHQIKPEWSYRLARDEHFDAPVITAQDLIVSDETLGEYLIFSPRVICERLARVFESATVVWVRRDPLKQFYSLYKQGLINTLLKAGSTGRLPPQNEVMKPDRLFDVLKKQYLREQRGFFASIDEKLNAGSYGRHFDFRVLKFEELERNPSTFAAAFAQICGAKGSPPPISRKNESNVSELQAALDKFPAENLAQHVRWIEALYLRPELSAERQDILRTMPR